MNKNDHPVAIRDMLGEIGDMMLTDGFDDCIIGWSYTPGPGHRVVYDAEKIIKNLIEQNELTLEEAWEHFEYNIEGSYLGEKTPVFLRWLEKRSI